MLKKALIISIGLAVITSLWTWVPWERARGIGGSAEPELLTVSGQPVDAEKVASLRVADYDQQEKAPEVFEVARKAGNWVIPSHFNYPADAGSKVGQTAGAVLNLPRGPLVADRKERHAEFGVLDPLAEGVAEVGEDVRGRRITLKDESGAALVDLILGKAAPPDLEPAGPGGASTRDLHYVRDAGSDAVYTAKVDLGSVSTVFRDWVEVDPLKITRGDIAEVSIQDYTVDESRGSIERRAQTVFSKQKPAEASAAAENWASAQTPADQRVKQSAVGDLLSEATGLRLVGVRPFDPAWLQARGFYLATRPGAAQPVTQIVGNEGALDLVSEDGLRYRLFFGEIALGDEQDVKPEAAATQPTTRAAAGDNRYMAVFVEYDPALDRRAVETLAAATQASTQPTTAPTAPTSEQIAAGQERAKQKMSRFGQFFYVISDESFRKLRPDRASLFEPIPPPATAPASLPVGVAAPDGPAAP